MNNEQAIKGQRMGLRYISGGYWEDREGCAWLLNPQKGWVRVSRTSRGLLLSRTLRTLMRFRGDPRAMGIAKRMGPFAVWDLQLGYST